VDAGHLKHGLVLLRVCPTSFKWMKHFKKNGNALVRTSGGGKNRRPAHHLIPHSRHARGTSSSTIPSILIHPILLHTPQIHSPALFFSRSRPRDNQLAAMRCHPDDDAPPQPSSGGWPGSSSLPSPGSSDGAPCTEWHELLLLSRASPTPMPPSAHGGAGRLPRRPRGEERRGCRTGGTAGGGQDVSVGGGGAARCGGAVAPHDLPSPEAYRHRVPEARGCPSIPPPLSSSLANPPSPCCSFLPHVQI
jgi:hypothetical protein